MLVFLRASAPVLLGLGLSACIGGEPGTEGPASLDTLVTNFDFATSRNVSVQLESEEGPVAVEITDAEGRRIMRGAFRDPGAVELRIPTGSEPVLNLRTQSGTSVRTQTLTVSPAGQARAKL